MLAEISASGLMLTSEKAQNYFCHNFLRGKLVEGSARMNLLEVENGEDRKRFDAVANPPDCELSIGY